MTQLDDTHMVSLTFLLLDLVILPSPEYHYVWQGVVELYTGNISL